MSFWKRLLKATAQRGRHGVCEIASAVQRRYVGYLPAFDFFRLPRGVQRRFLSNSLNCRTSSSDISGYYAGFQEGHGTENGRGAALYVWITRHSMAGERNENGMGPACHVWISLKRIVRPVSKWLPYFFFKNLLPSIQFKSPVHPHILNFIIKINNKRFRVANLY
jgi:hypothetical protein